MKIALDHTSEIGVRAGRLLLGEPALDQLGIVRRNVKDRDRRLKRINEVTGFDAVATDDPDSSILAEAVAAGVPCVLWSEAADASVDVGSTPVLAGANFVTGIGRSLVERATDDAAGDAQLLFAWTEPGKPIRSGEPVSFPEPVGARWGSRRAMTNRRLEVASPVPDEWAGIVVRASTDAATLTFGVADLATHLEAIALAAGAVIAAMGTIPSGEHRPNEFTNDYLAAAFLTGLDVATFTGAG